MLKPMAEAAVEKSVKSTAELLRKQIPTLGNIVAVEVLTATIRFRYRKRVFDAPPINVLDGLRLKNLELELQRIGNGGVPEDGEGSTLLRLKLALEEGFTIMHRNVRPVTLFDRLFWRWRANPFLDANTKEVAELLHFFSLCRMTSGANLLSVKSPERRRRR